MSMTISGTQIAFPDASTQNTAATGFGFKNRIINGAMMIDQRNAGASLTTNGAYTLDRWFFETSNTGNNTVQKVGDAPVGFYNSLKITTTTGTSLVSGSYLDFSQPIEGFNCSDFGFGSSSASNVAVSFWVKSSVTGIYSVCLRMPNAGTPVGSVQTITINSANTWEQKSVVFTGNTATGLVADNTAQLRLYVILAAGSTYQTSSSNTWVSTASGYVALNTQSSGMLTTTGATFQITGVQLEKGSTATSFDYRPYGTELALCQRYYERLNYTDINSFMSGMISASNPISQFITWKVTKRGTTTGGRSAANAVLLYSGGNITSTAVTTNATPAGFALDISIGSTITTNSAVYSWPNSSWFDGSAEL